MSREKMNKNIYIFFSGLLYFFILASCSTVFSQEVEPDSTLDEQQIQRIENYSEQTGAEIDYTDMLADLEYYMKHPVNINNADYEDLAALKILNDIQINNLLNHIRKNGKLLSIYELQSVDGFDAELIARLTPYITIGAVSDKASFNFKDLFRHGKSDVFIRYQRVLEQQKGYVNVSDSVYNLSPNSHYLGSPDKLFVKYRYNYYNKVMWGFTAEKDAGEQFFKGVNKYGYDYYSGFLTLKNVGIFKTISLGDYNVQFGQGLTLWTGLSFGKSSDASNIKKIARGISPYSSAYESGFMRGAAFTVGIKNIELTGFYSSKKVDGSVSGNDTLEQTDYVITSLTEDGLHNTQSSSGKKNAINEQVYGGHIAYKTRAINVGVTAYGLHLSVPYQKNDIPYNMFEYRGQNNFNLGIDYSFIIRNFNIFGETARSQNGGIASINGLMMNVDRYITCVVAYRHYQRNYQSMFTSAFGESGNTYNESGFYTGISIKPYYKLLITAYADFYSFPWLKYQVNSPSNGFDCNIGLQYKPTKKITINLRYKYENKQINSSDEEADIDYNVPYSRENYRFHISYPVSNALTFANRVEVSRYKDNNSSPEYGYLLYQDIRYKISRSPLSASFRFAVFDAKSYDARMYAYENDVLYAYSIPMFYDQGIRYYLMLKYALGRHIDIWLRFAQTFYNNKTSISSGLNEINGNKQSEIKAQVRFKF